MYDVLQKRSPQQGTALVKPTGAPPRLAGYASPEHKLTQEAARPATGLPADMELVLKPADAEARQLLEKFWSSNGPAAQAWLRRATDELLRPTPTERPLTRPAGGIAPVPKQVDIHVSHASESGGETTRTDQGFRIEIHPLNSQPPGTAAGQVASPGNVAMLADELYTVYQALVSKRIAYEREETEEFDDYETPTDKQKKKAEKTKAAQKTKEPTEKEKAKEARKREVSYSVRAYDILDELETKIASAMSLRDQGMKLDYVEQMLAIEKNSPSFTIIRQLYQVLDQLEAGRPGNKPPITVEEVKDKFMSDFATAEPALLRLFSYRENFLSKRNGYHDLFNIKYSSIAEQATRLGDAGSGGQTYLQETIGAYIDKLHPELAQLSEKKRAEERDKKIAPLYEAEVLKLKERGVRYKFNAEFNPDDNKSEVKK